MGCPSTPAEKLFTYGKTTASPNPTGARPRDVSLQTRMEKTASSWGVRHHRPSIQVASRLRRRDNNSQNKWYPRQWTDRPFHNHLLCGSVTTQDFPLHLRRSDPTSTRPRVDRPLSMMPRADGVQPRQEGVDPFVFRPVRRTAVTARREVGSAPMKIMVGTNVVLTNRPKVREDLKMDWLSAGVVTSYA